jgi:translation initiation factor IF-2
MKNQESTKNEVIFPPVVAVLGHVDHGKTTLLDTIRKTNIAAREHGGITQKIGASEIEIIHEGKKRRITFIDTPGHEAFSLMRGRGVQAADIGILVISVTDGIMPQTKESIELLKASKIPFIVALTKSDLAEKNVAKVKQQLGNEEIVLEEYGGDVPVIEVSAKTNINIKELLDLILLVYDLKRQANFYTGSSTNPLEAVIIESKLDPKAGPKATLIIKNGQVSLRDGLSCGEASARVRSILNPSGIQLKTATVGDAVEVLGFANAPKVGEIVRPKSQQETIKQEVVVEAPTTMSKEEFLNIAAIETRDVLSIILCADTLGSLEAIINSMPKKAKIILQKTGDIEASDILQAKSSGAVILGFNIKVKPEVAKLAETEKVLFKNYTIIYEMIGEVSDLLEGKALAMQEKIYGKAKILARFPFEKTEVLGIGILEGRIAKGDRVRLTRDDNVIGESTIISVRQGKEQTSKVEQGQEAGIVISPSLDFTIGDVLISHA